MQNLEIDNNQGLNKEVLDTQLTIKIQKTQNDYKRVFWGISLGVILLFFGLIIAPALSNQQIVYSESTPQLDEDLSNVLDFS